MIKVISTTEARTMLPDFLESFNEGESVFVIGRRNKPEGVLIKFPSDYSSSFSDITNINNYSSSFDFLLDEPELFTKEDIIKSNAKNK